MLYIAHNIHVYIHDIIPILTLNNKELCSYNVFVFRKCDISWIFVGRKGIKIMFF